MPDRAAGVVIALLFAVVMIIMYTASRQSPDEPVTSVESRNAQPRVEPRIVRWEIGAGDAETVADVARQMPPGQILRCSLVDLPDAQRRCEVLDGDTVLARFYVYDPSAPVPRARVRERTPVVGRPAAGPRTSGTTAGAAEQREPEPAEPLVLIAQTGTIGEYGFSTVEGQVRNVSGGPMENVMVVVTWLTDDGQFITSDEALISYNPILNGQTSPFEVITQTNPAMKRFRVEFKELFGRPIPFRRDAE